MSRTQQIRQVQYLPIPVEEAWQFFSHAKNLAVLTPGYLNLKFTNAIGTGEIFPGQIITYNIKPLLRIPLFWMTEITKVERLRLFIDEQRKGPYALWHHEHYFRPVAGGTEMTDQVDYRLPFGFVGQLGLPLVKKQLREIFAYRRQKITELFGALDYR